MNRFNHFTPETKKSYEQLGLALAIFMKCKDQTETLLVSDGLCQLYHLKRKELMAYFNGAAADEHYSLTKKRVEVLVNQILGADRQTITVRVKINNFYHTLLLHAKRQQLADGSLLCFIDYFDLSADQLEVTPKADRNAPDAPRYKDDLTGLVNTTYLNRFGRDFLVDKLDEGLRPVIILFNVTGMRAFNDRYDYRQGDRLLIKLGQILVQTFTSGLVIKHSEDRFIVLTTATDYIAKIKTAQKLFVAGISNSLTNIKAGIYYYENRAEGMEAALDKARQALQYTGSDLTQLYHVYDSAVQESFGNRDYVLTHFWEALDKRWIQPYYQMEIRSLTGQICGYEALARWIDPDKGILSPATFISVLEDMHLINLLDLSIVEQVCETIHDCLEDGIPVQPISINLSRVDFQVCDIFQEVDRIRKKHDIPPYYLKIEILESTLTRVPGQLRLAMSKFHQAGYQIWMDDFGSGYSSLNNLKDFNFDLIKIDMIFLKDFANNPKNRIILSSIVNMAKQLGLHTLCEGVETKEQADFLRDIGCERLQGFRFSKPLPLEEVISLIHKNGYGHYEPVELNDYYDQAGLANLLIDPMSDSNVLDKRQLAWPVSIIERRSDDSLRLYYIDRAYQKQLEEAGFSQGSWQDQINYSNVYHHLLLDLMSESQQTRVPATLTLNGFTINVRFLAKHDDRQMYVCTIQNFAQYVYLAQKCR